MLAEVDVRTQGVQRHATLAVELRTRHLSAAQTPGALDTDTLGTGTHGGGDGLLHRAAEGHTCGQLLGDALRDQLSVGLRALDLEDVQLDLLGGELLQLTADAICLSTAAADHDARTRSVDVHTDAVAGPLDLDLRDAGALDALLQQLADLDVFLHEVLVALTLFAGVGEPVGDVVSGDAQTETIGVDLLSHY